VFSKYLGRESEIFEMVVVVVDGVCDGIFFVF